MTLAGWGKAVLAAALLVALSAPPAPGQGTATETVGFSIQVEPVFVVESASEEGGNIELPLRLGEPASRTARVSIRSNTGRPYRIVQRLEQPFSGGRGGDLAEEPVSFTVTDGARGGRGEAKSPQPLTTQPAALFTSGPGGESDDFTISYSVSSKQLFPAGNYQARILIEEEFR